MAGRLPAVYQPMSNPEDQNKQDPRQTRSLYDRYMAARNWLWSSWTDEAVMIYRRSAKGQRGGRLIWLEFLLFVREILREFYTVNGGGRAASLAYTTLLSLIPFVVAMSQVLKSYFSNVFPDFRAQIDTFLNIILPYQSSTFASHINRFVENAESASTFGAIIFLLISFRLFMAVEGAINDIWKVPSARGYRQKIRAFTMLLFWGPVLIGLSFTTSAMLEQNPYLQAIFQSHLLIRLVPSLVMFLAFTMLFWLVPSTRVWFKSAVVGALVTTILFELVRWGFGIYAEHLFKGNLNVIYGTLGLVVIFLIALDTMWMVILIGVEVSYIHQNLPGILRASEEQLEEDARYDLYFALRSLLEISRQFSLREDAPSAYRLAKEFGATDRQMLAVLRRLEDAKLVKEIGGDWTGFAPGCDPDRITLEEVVRVMEGGSRDIPKFDESDPVQRAIHSVFTTLRTCTAEALGRMSVGYLVRELDGEPVVQRPDDPLSAVIPAESER